MKTVIHVNQHNIKANRKSFKENPKAAFEGLPVLTVKDYKQNRKGYSAILRDDDGVEVGRFRYSPDEPLACGAVVWFETYLQVEVQ